MSVTAAATRAQVLGYRLAAQGLHRDGTSVAGLAVLDLGMQEAMGSPAGLAFAARLPPDVVLGPGNPSVGPGHRLAIGWTLRGAPHVHRRRDLDALTAALAPLSEQDAAGRLNETGPSIRRSGIPALDQFAAARDALRDVVSGPMPKGEVSTEVSRRVPRAMLRDCRVCKAAHLSDPALRVASLAAGLEFEPGASPPVLVPRAGATPDERADPGALRRLALRYFALLGPATVGDFAGYLEARRADVAIALGDLAKDLAEVSVDGRPALLPTAQLAELADPPAAEIVRLLGPFDPWLQARDRSLIVADKAVQKALWPVLGRPGALLIDGEIAGTWRAKSSGGRLALTVEAFAPLDPVVWRQVEDEARRVGELRGATDVRVARTD